MIVSDNGKTFKGQELKRFNAKHGIKWRFNLPKTPWWGGMFERMVRSTKRCLLKTIGLRKLTYEELCTVLMEVEAVINNRPLVYIEENDQDQILTPSHLFCGRRTLDTQSEIGSDIKTDIKRDEVISRTKKINASIDHFWKRWSHEYLVELRENHKMKMKTKSVDINKGDVVLIHEDGVKRNSWSMAVIEDLIVGKDGVTRGATVRKMGDDGKRSRLNRPLQKLYPLEITPDDQSTTGVASSHDGDDPTSPRNDDIDNATGEVSTDDLSATTSCHDDSTSPTTPRRDDSTSATTPQRDDSTSATTPRRNDSTSPTSQDSMNSDSTTSSTNHGTTTSDPTTAGSERTTRSTRRAAIDGERRRRDLN
jgi:hypothetical protein